jgi:hypothetical protein
MRRSYNEARGRTERIWEEQLEKYKNRSEVCPFIACSK